MSDTSWNVHDYPDGPPDNPEPECPWCGWSLSDEVYELDGVFICAKCYKEYIFDEIGLEAIADALGTVHKAKEDLYEQLF